MFAISILSTILLISICILLIWYFISKKNKKNSAIKTKLVSRKNYNKEIEILNDYKKEVENEIKEMINNFIKEQTTKFNNEKNYELKKELLIEIKKDIQLITNSFTWEKVKTIPELESKYQYYINILKKQRPSKWIKIS